MQSKINISDNAATSDIEEEIHSSVEKINLEPDISLHGELNLNDYLQDVSPTRKTTEEILTWANERESTRTKIVLWLVGILGCSLVAAFTLVGVAIFNPNADKQLIKDLFPQFITTPVTLLSLALGFYFSNRNTNH